MNVEQDTNLPPSQSALEIATDCWSDPRVENCVPDTNLALVIAEKIDEYREALIWCSGALDFQQVGDGVPEGRAHIGFDKIVRPLIKCN